jgi:hypothetical protein
LALYLQIEIAQYVSMRYHTWLPNRLDKVVKVCGGNGVGMWNNKKVRFIINRANNEIKPIENLEVIDTSLLEERNSNRVASYLFENERDAIIEAVDNLIEVGIFSSASGTVDGNPRLKELQYLFFYHSPKHPDDPDAPFAPFDGFPKSIKSNDIQVAIYLFETYCCLTMLDKQEGKVNNQVELLFQQHADLIEEKLGKLGNDSDFNSCTQSQMSISWKDFFNKQLMQSNLTIKMLDSWTGEIFPREILSIILQYDTLCDDRVLQEDAQKLVYERLTFLKKS